MGARGRRVSPKQLRISQPSKDIGQMGMTRKECEKNHLTRVQGHSRQELWEKERKGEERSSQGQGPSTQGFRLSSSQVLRNKSIQAQSRSIKADLLRAALE